MSNVGKAFRMRRLSLPNDGRYLFVPLDHSVSDGPVVPQNQWTDLVRALVAGGADAIVVHKGRARTIAPEVLAGCALIIHLSAGTAYAADAQAKTLVGDVADAVRLGADAVSVHVNIGSATETEQLHDLGLVASACDTWNMPLLVMIYPRGPRILDPRDPALLAHMVNIAADVGADLVKTSVTLPIERMAEVVAGSPVPVLAAGGSADHGDLLVYAETLMAAGCRGLAVGRRVFSSADPAKAVAGLADVVHRDTI
ncbi:MAG TPA: 2-amino-3,7-dideoxy-D-threo-hept-6-ulosonate synthase [Actinocrinis sp.]|nr:2-amino-3,7-dideoxy-D-threo-hept-6-ulosonate synthase [Actinocrinis sp.]